MSAASPATRPVAPREDRALAAVGLMALAVVCFTGVDSSAKWLSLAGLPVVQVVFVRYAVHFVLTVGLVLPRTGLGAFRSRRPVVQAARCTALLAVTLLNFTALKSLPITVTTSIMFAAPVIVTLMAIPILGERVGLRRVLAVLTGFAGVLLVTRPWGADWHPAMLLSLGAVLCSSLYFILTRMLAGDEANVTSQLWSSGLSSAVLAGPALAAWQGPGGPTEWLVLGLVGCFGAAGHTLVVVAHRFAGAALLAPLVYLQILLASVAGVLLFGTWPTWWTLAGGAVIAAAGLYIARRERAQRRAEANPA